MFHAGHVSKLSICQTWPNKKIHIDGYNLKITKNNTHFPHKFMDLMLL